MQLQLFYNYLWFCIDMDLVSEIKNMHVCEYVCNETLFYGLTYILMRVKVEWLCHNIMSLVC